VVDRRAGRVYDFAPLQGETIEEDLAQRDFSVNAMARPLDPGVAAAAMAEGSAAAALTTGELIDPLGGRADIEARTLRVLGPAAYENDPLRPLRLARFVGELGFAPDA
jgi:poly(A) polymerase